MLEVSHANYYFFFLNFRHFAILAAAMIPLHFGIKKKKKKTKVAMHSIIMFNFLNPTFLFFFYPLDLRSLPTLLTIQSQLQKWFFGQEQESESA